MARRLDMQPMTAEQLLDRGLVERSDLLARPRPMPREVFAAWLGNAGVGVGAGVLAGIVLGLLRAPDAVLWLWPFVTGGGAFAGMMIWHGSQDERAFWANGRAVKRAFAQAQREIDAERQQWQRRESVYLGELDKADAEITQLQKANDELARERDRATYALTAARTDAQQGQRLTYVAPRELAPEHIRDATQMMNHRYSVGAHPSKGHCMDVWKWTQPRWQKAQDALVAAGVLAINTTQPKWLARTIDEAYQMFGEYMIHVELLSAPTVNRTLGVSLYVESEME